MHTRKYHEGNPNPCINTTEQMIQELWGIAFLMVITLVPFILLGLVLIAGVLAIPYGIVILVAIFKKRKNY